jgi:hypothetical protein
MAKKKPGPKSGSASQKFSAGPDDVSLGGGDDPTPDQAAEPGGESEGGTPGTYKTLEEFYAAHPEALSKWEDDGVVAAVAETHQPPVGKMTRPTTTPRPEKRIVRSEPLRKLPLRRKGKK